MTNMHSPSILLFFLITALLISHHLKCEATDTMNARNPLNDSGETLVSAGSRFELGFFSPQDDHKGSRYVGVWYKFPKTIVWVANRKHPLSGSCGSFGIAEDGSLKVWCGSEEIATIKSVDGAANQNLTLQLLDSGNLILVDGRSGGPLWQSFNDTTDTFLPGMVLNGDVKLTSWKSPTDPAVGNYTFRKDGEDYVIQKRSSVHWRSGEPGLFQTSDGLPSLVNQLLSNTSPEYNQSRGENKESRHINYTGFKNALSFNNSRLVMAYSGEIKYYSLIEDNSWSLVWSEPQNNCSVYNACGKFGICDLKKEPMCSCPQGFKPTSSEDWSGGQHSEGCDRDSKACKGNNRFLNISVMKVGGQVTQFDQAETERACREECLGDCSCEAYLYRDVNGSDRGGTRESATKCWIWTTALVNVQEDNIGRFNLSLRVPSGPALANAGDDTKIPKSKSHKRSVVVVVVVVIIVGVTLVSWSHILYKRRSKARQSGNDGITGDTPMLFSNNSDRQANDMMQENDKRIDVPFYNLDVVLSATNFFSDANKLGQGGFGPVYKGKFPGGREIAVKRLSSSSAQGIDEFLNEVVLIAKLQHRNLVRLLGYCIKNNEKILLYEYMPNRSLDAFIFDQHNRLLLDWKKRFDIILGIARGLLYLHQDSRLRIIHRDLKTSNILLDEDMNPKISDFGLARIVEGKGTEASTNKVVGTYGYMSPEYALDGKFSVKSDVFSFGVVVLEIICGKKNTGFYNPQEVLNLLGYAWRLWSENKALDLIDPTLLESCDKSQAMKCINIGLLCVQEDPNERPSMSTVVIMLGSESATTLPIPTQPAFVVRKRISSTSSSSSTKPDAISVNEMSFSMAQGR